MYWTSHLSQSANLDTILEKGVAGLDDLLDLDNIILKTRNGDERLVAFLTREKVLARLVEYSVGVGLVGEKAMRYPLIAAEILCCEQPPVWQAVQRHTEVLAPVWKFPETNLAPFLVCWSRLLSHLLLKMPVGTGETLKLAPEFLDAVMSHISIPEVSEILFKLIALMTGTGDCRTPLLLNWMLTEEKFTERAFSRLTVEFEADSHMAIQNFVAGLLNFGGYPEEFPLVNIAKALIKELEPVIDRITSEEDPDSVLFAVVVDIIGLIIDKVVERRSESRWSALPGQLSTVIVPKLERFHAILAPMRNLVKYNSPAGTINPVGMVRLKAAKFFADITQLNDVRIITGIKELGTATALFELFFLHQHNNLLHTEVTDFVHNVFEGEFALNRDLIISMFRDGRLTMRIVKAQRVNDAAILNHMGHITLISDEIFKLLEQHGEDLKSTLLSELEHEDWLEYGEVAYRETKVKDAMVLGGTRAPPPPTDETPSSFTGIFSTGTDEQLARYFCQQVIANLPNRFIFTDDSDEEEMPSIEIPVEPNGMDGIVDMEMRFSALGDLPDSTGEDEEAEEPEVIEWTLRRGSVENKK